MTLDKHWSPEEAVAEAKDKAGWSTAMALIVTCSFFDLLPNSDREMFQEYLDNCVEDEKRMGEE